MIQLKLEPCIAPFWAQGGHAQTLLGHLIPSPRFPMPGVVGDPVIGDKVRIDLPDGDQLDATFYSGGAGSSGDVIVYIFHGLGGSADSSYMHRTAALAHRMGHSVYLVNHRGCGEGRKLVAREPYHSGRGEDLAAAIALGRARFPSALHIAVGFSLSANALLLLLSGARGETLPDRAIAVNAPIRLDHAARRLSSGFMNRVYGQRFVYDCLEGVKDQQKKGWVPAELRIPLWKSIEDFDSLYTAPRGGFSSREEYYSTCSTQKRLKDIRTPTVLITAEDDPFVPFQDYREAQFSDSIFFHAEKTGGHMGYLTARKTPLGTNRWLDYALHEAFKALMTEEHRRSSLLSLRYVIT